MKIEEYLSTLPQSILSGEEIQIPPDTIREIFRFTNLGKNDIFYHLGCGDGTSLSIAREEFNVKNAIGIDNSEKMINIAKKMINEIDHFILNVDDNFSPTQLKENFKLFSYALLMKNEFEIHSLFLLHL